MAVHKQTAVDGICNRQGWVSLNNYYFLYRVRSALPRGVVYSSSAEKSVYVCHRGFQFQMRAKVVYVLKIAFSIVQGTIIALVSSDVCLFCLLHTYVLTSRSNKIAGYSYILSFRLA